MSPVRTLFTQTPATAALLASFVLLYVLQVFTGVDASQPSAAALLKWGANFFPLTLTTEPWRLISSAFLHIGFMHLLFNSFAMYFFGQVAEMTFGASKFLALFLLAAIGGNLLNNYVTWWQIIQTNNLAEVRLGTSAGASGGIMGIGAALLVVAGLRYFKPDWFATTTESTHTNNKQQLKSLALIMGVNLLYGFAVPGIDNAGHIGGALTGALIAAVLVPSYRLLNNKAHTLQASTTAVLKWLPWGTIAIISIVFYALWVYLHHQLLALV